MTPPHRSRRFTTFFSNGLVSAPLQTVCSVSCVLPPVVEAGIPRLPRPRAEDAAAAGDGVPRRRRSHSVPQDRLRQRRPPLSPDRRGRAGTGAALAVRGQEVLRLRVVGSGGSGGVGLAGDAPHALGLFQDGLFPNLPWASSGGLRAAEGKHV